MPLIGVDDRETPYWARGYEKVVQASLREVAVAVPRTMAQIVRFTDAAARSGADAVLVTHRLANVRHADQIVVLEGGRSSSWARTRS